MFRPPWVPSPPSDDWQELDVALGEDYVPELAPGMLMIELVEPEPRSYVRPTPPVYCGGSR